eukprot:gene4590-14777_t
MLKVDMPSPTHAGKAHRGAAKPSEKKGGSAKETLLVLLGLALFLSAVWFWAAHHMYINHMQDKAASKHHFVTTST